MATVWPTVITHGIIHYGLLESSTVLVPTWVGLHCSEKSCNDAGFTGPRPTTHAHLPECANSGVNKTHQCSRFWTKNPSRSTSNEDNDCYIIIETHSLLTLLPDLTSNETFLVYERAKWEHKKSAYRYKHPHARTENGISAIVNSHIQHSAEEGYTDKEKWREENSVLRAKLLTS